MVAKIRLHVDFWLIRWNRKSPTPALAVSSPPVTVAEDGRTYLSCLELDTTLSSSSVSRAQSYVKFTREIEVACLSGLERRQS